MKLRRNEWFVCALILTLFIFGVCVYPAMPERIASHWNTEGAVDGYMPRFWGTFFMPILALILGIVFFVIPRVDPKKENIEKFRVYFDEFILVLFLFFSYIYWLTIAWNFGCTFNLTLFIIPALSILFMLMGRLISHAEPNWTIGIRTPWTISSPSVWEKTHRVAGKFFVLSGVIALLGMAFPGIAFWFVIVPILLTAFGSAWYSYILFKKETLGK